MRALIILVLGGTILCLAAGRTKGAPTDELLALQGSQRDNVVYQKFHGRAAGYHNLLIREPAFGDFVLEAGLRGGSGVTHFGLVFRYQDPENLYRLVLRSLTKDFRVEKVLQGKSDYASARHVSLPYTVNQWYHVQLSARGRHVEVRIDGKLLYASDAFTELTAGRAGLTVYDPAPAEFDNIRITAADGRKLLFDDDFNAGRLDRWVAAGPEGVTGQWGMQPKVAKVPPRRDFVTHYGIQVGPSTGWNQSMFEFPSITKLADGQLLTLFIEENQHGTPPWAAMPTCGKLWMARSGDLGRTWSPAAPFLDTPIDDRHAYTLPLANGDLLAFFWVQPVALGIDGIWNYVAVSRDGGHTWFDPVRFRTGRRIGAQPGRPTVEGGVSLTVPPMQLPDGSLAMPVHCVLPGKKPPSEIGVLRSRDNGRTWGDYTTIAYDPTGVICFVEPAAVRLASGKWIVVTRTEIPVTPGTTHPYTLGPQMICTSADEGRTWTRPARLPLDFTWSGSTNPFILQTKTGVVVFAVNTGTAFSYDEGKTWVQQELPCGYYPNLLEISPGTLASLACAMTGSVFSLTRPQPATPPPPGARWVLPNAPVKRATAAPAPGTEALEIGGMFKTIRLRPPRDRRMSPLLAQPGHALLAVGRVRTDRGPAIQAVVRSPNGVWSRPRLLAQTPSPAGEPVVAQSHGGTVLCAFPARSEGRLRMMLMRSSDHAATWTPPLPMVVEGSDAGLLLTAPPCEEADGAWIAAGAAGSEGGPIGVFRSTDGGTTWRPVAAGPVPARSWIEPSLAVARDGRWVLVARQAGAQEHGREVMVTTSADLGKTWSAPRSTGLKGLRPEIVELLDTLFFLVAEGDAARLHVAIAWDELDCFCPRNLACGWCLRLEGRTLLARGSGVDVAGQYHNLAQVPPTPGEIEAARRKAVVRLAPSEPRFRFRGRWEPVASGAEKDVRTSGDSHASMEAEFDGAAVLLIHDTARDGRLVGVKIDGREYPPVDMRGADKSTITTCLAPDLPPGRHRLVLWPLLPWSPGRMFVRGLQVAPSDP